MHYSLEITSQHSVGSGRGFGGPDTYVAVQCVPCGVTPLTSLQAQLYAWSRYRQSPSLYCRTGGEDVMDLLKHDTHRDVYTIYDGGKTYSTLWYFADYLGDVLTVSREGCYRRYTLCENLGHGVYWAEREEA